MPGKGVKLQVRKLSFDSVVERQQKAARDSAAAAVAGQDAGKSSATEVSRPGVEGLPALLKRLRQDAQTEIERATASVTTLRTCLAKELSLMEAERRASELHHHHAAEGLRATIGTMQKAAEQMTQAKSEVEAELAAAEKRNEELVAQVALLKQEALRAKERMDAMEAADAFLQSEATEEDSPRTRMQARSQMLGSVEEELVGARSARGAVSLVNVPAMHGGVMHVGATSDEPSAPATARALPSWGRNPLAPAGAPSSNKAETEKKGGLPRKLSFGRKGRRLVRSLSFGHERPKPEWGAAAS